MSDRCEATAQPQFRPAQIISEAEAELAIASGDPERARLALIDGSRCLAPEWPLRHAAAFTMRDDPALRWAAIFALNQAIPAWLPMLSEDPELLALLCHNATDDPDYGVRAIAVATLADVIHRMLQPPPVTPTDS